MFLMLIIFFSIATIKGHQLFIANIPVFTLNSWASFLMFTMHPGGRLQSLESPDVTHFLIQSVVLEFYLSFGNFSQADSEITH